MELHDGTVGVNYAKDGKEAWTRVVRRRKNRLNVAIPTVTAVTVKLT